ncbi:helix-turn-helix transcriptional regulator [Metasolibacillus fluoroglycofenilyticus]|uniref:helix-turn-helix transcriptional regulator n=1 Tax=Metasolibacillus fluoroglycofenilyticus TaxID=1239396 RepID=UPI000D342E19|nr:YafY family protein [Metasolibacillus fluoroglycofenilyticus]
MKVERMFAIVVFLLHKRIVTADELAERLEVSKRTIYRDIDSLCAAGIPIVSHLGKNGGFTLADRYQLNKLTFSDTEKKLVMDGITLGNELFEEQQLANLQQKLALFQEEYDISFTLSNATLHRNIIEQQTKNKIQQLLAFIENEQAIEISYVAQNGHFTTRTVLPIKLHLQNGSWYAEAFCQLREAYRFFKLTRIRTMETIEATIKQPLLVSTTERPVELEQIILQFGLSEHGKLYDFFTEGELAIHSEHIIAKFHYDITNDILPFIRMFGSKVKILAPAWLQQKHLEEIKKILES